MKVSNNTATVSNVRIEITVDSISRDKSYEIFAIFANKVIQTYIGSQKIFQIRSFQLSSILIFIGLDVDEALNPI